MVQYSTNFIDWIPVITNNAFRGFLTWTNDVSAGGALYFRAVQPD